MMAPCGRRRGRGNGCDLTRCLHAMDFTLFKASIEYGVWREGKWYVSEACGVVVVIVALALALDLRR